MNARPRSCGPALWAAVAAVVFTTGCGAKSTTRPIIKPNPSSRSWQDLHLTTSYAQTNALADFHDELYVGGVFFDAAGWPRSSFLAWNGSVWRLVGGQPNGDVTALAVHGDRLYAGGTFTHARY